jgi:hypothetical protein
MADNSLGKAQILGTLGASPVARRNFVGQRDRVDTFKFGINSSNGSTASFSLTRLRANADFALLNSSGRQIIKASKSGNRPERIQTSLTAGTYYLRVTSRAGKGTNYRLAASAVANPIATPTPVPTPIPAPIPVEGTISNPINLGTLTGGTITRPQDIAPANSPKYYRFQLAQISNVNLTLSQTSQSTAIRLYYDSNANGLPDDNELIESGSGSPSGSNPISEALPAKGTYFVKVDSNSISTGSTYDLLVATTPTPGNIPAEAGNDASTAYSLGTLNSGGRIDIKEYVGELDGLDYYRFNVATNSTVSFNKLSVSEGFLSATLYRDSNGNGLVDSGERVTGLSQSESVTLESGATYYLELSASAAYNIAYTYSLSI